MYKKIETLHRLCEALIEELEEYSKKIEKSEGMSAGDLEAVDKLSHALKSIKTTIAMMEAEDEGGNSHRSMPWYGGMSYEDDRMNRGVSRARGRGGRRDAMGRYSRDGYSYAEEEFQKSIEEALNAAPNEHVREKLKRIMDEA